MNKVQFSLAGQIALITGASRGIGRAIALAYAAAGAEVALVSRSVEALAQVVSEIQQGGGRAGAEPGDVSRQEDIDRIVQHVMGSHGRVDVLVNCAGISPIYTRTMKITLDQWQTILDTNLTGTFLMCQAVGRYMLAAQKGSVINITSMGARVGLPRLSAYCASKAGVEALTRVLALEWAEYGVRVNAIAPGYVNTEMTAGFKEKPQLYEQVLAHTPMRRLADPQEIAGAAIFLASEAASFMTGQTIVVDGGWMAE